MGRASNSLVLVLLSIGAAVGQQLPRNVMTTTGKSQVQYCDSDADLAVAIIHTTVDFANRGDENVILSRKLGDIEDLSVSDASGKVVYSPHPSYYGTGTPEFGAAPELKLFEILPPGSTVHRDFVIRIPISKDPTRRIGSTPSPGKYKISAQRSTWPFYGDEDLAVKLERKWAQYGELFIDRIRVKDLPTEISLPYNMPPCKREE